MNLDELAKRYGGSPVESGSSKFDELAQKYGGVAAEVEAKPVETSGFLRQVADVPLGIGKGAATGVRMIADAFGAGSGASEAIKGVEGYLSGLMSAQAKNDEKEVARIMKEAEDKGVLDQVKAGFKAFSVAPIDLLSQGFGTAAPAVLGILGAKVLGAGALGMSAIGTGVGAGMGAGSAKGGIYEEVKATLKESGVDDAKAEQVAIEAQKYGGKNMDQILLSAGLGGLAGRFGLESSAKRMLTGAVGKEAGKSAAREMAEGATRTAVTESVPELLQGSQEQVAKNIALQREGFDVPTMRGVAGSGTLEALAGAGLGAVSGGTEAGLRRQARGEADRILADEQKAAADAEQAQYEEQQFKKKYEPQKVEQEPAPEPYVSPKPISGTEPSSLLGGREDPLAKVVSERRAAAEPTGEIPLIDHYAFLQQAKQRWHQQDQTPETKKLLGRINDQIGEVLKRDIERLRTEAETLKRNREADAEAEKTSVFGREELPPIESRDVVVGNLELEKLQAREEPPAYPLTAREAKRVGEMEGIPQPVIPEVAAEVEKLTKDQELAIAERERLEKRTSGTSLSQVLRGTLRDAELSELGGRARQVGKNPFLNLKAPKGQIGSSMEDMVDTGKLNLFLPVNLRPDSPEYVNSESAEYIREKLRNNQPYTYETELAIQRVDQDIESIEREIRDLLSDDEINKELQYAANEQRELDQAAQEPAPQEADRAPEQREAEKADADFERRKAQLDREEQLNEREARLLEERKRLEAERLELEKPTQQDVVDQEKRKAEAEKLDEREQVRKESEAGAGQFELAREEGRQDTTGGLFEQPVAAPEAEPALVEISTEEERKTALDKFKRSLLTVISPFSSRGGDNRVSVIKPTPLSNPLLNEVMKLASAALDLGLPPAVLGDVNKAGSTRSDAIAMMTNSGWLMIGKQWKSASDAVKLLGFIHELGHVLDANANNISGEPKWDKAHKELQEWYRSSADKFRHPLAYPFSSQYKGKVRIKAESFAQAFGYYFTSPVDLQKNAPEAYSQIQSIVERIQDGSQAARAAGKTETGTTGIKVQPTRATRGAAVQPDTREVGAAVGTTARLEDRGVEEVTKPTPVTFYEDIPNESWLQGKIDYALETPRTKFGVPRMSSQTGYFNRPVLVPARFFDGVRGQRGEQDNVRQGSLSAIRKIIRETGKMPLNDDGTEYVPYVEIAYDGKPYISEGNHRVMAAIAEGMEYIPVQLRYFDGGQRRAGRWNPENLKEITERVGAGDSDVQDINAMQAKAPPTDSAAFKRWFGDSKVVDENGEPLVMYHSTTANFNIFDTTRRALSGEGSYFSSSPVKLYGDEGENVMPVYLSLKNPKIIGERESSDVLKKKFIEQGHDGVIRIQGGKIVTAVAFYPNQIKSATGNVGAYDPEIQDINFSRDSITGKPILSQWTTPTDTKLAGDIGKDDIIYSLQNKMIDTKRVVDAITATAGKIMAKWNPYLQEELYHGRTAKQTKDFLTEELRPLMQAMEKSGVNIADMEEYLKNRHAIAYNAQVAKVNPNMPDKGSGIATADAQNYLNSLSAADKAKYESLAKKVDDITKGTRKLLVDSGLETQETIDNWEDTFPFYVPLKRGDIDYAYTAGGMGTGQGFDVRGDFSRRAMGSEREATDVLANVAMMRERAIVKSQKNRVAQALFGLAAQSPNPDFWLPVDPLAEVDPANMQELLNFGLSQQDLDFIAKEPRQKAIDKRRNEVVERINATLRNNENVLSMRFNGENRYVFFNPNDPRAERMVKSLKNLDADQLGGILGPISTVTRWMAAVNTQYNPIFGAYNFLRDVQGAALQLSDTPLAKDRKAVVGGTLPALKGIYAALRAERDGTKATGPWADLWTEFQEQGGQTGFRDQFSRSQERAEALQKELNMIKEGKLKSAGRATFNWLSDYNDSMENAVRLSAYKAALDNGIGKEEAASIAKNLTVNFNRKGQIGVQAGALYAFFNAAMQGTTRLVQTLRGPAGKKIIAGGLLLGSMQAALLAAAGFDEEEPPEFVRERNLILPIGGDKYIAFPMPLGYHVIPGTSRILTEWALSGFKNTPERIASLTGMYLEAFNPIGNAGWSAQTLAPTFADPIVALTENKDWTGKPIARKDFSNLDPTPGYTRAKDTASLFSTQIAKFLNYASGGTQFKPGVLSPTPDQIDYLIGQGTGGLGREALKVEQTISKTISGEELPPYKIPLVGRFYGETKSSAAESGRFYKNLTKLNEHENEIKGRRESKQPVAEYIAENPEARLAPMGRKIYAEIQNLKKRKAGLVERGAPRESVQAVEKMITRKMQLLNERVAKLEE